MTARHLLESLERQGVRLWSDNGRLRYRGPATAVTPEAMEAMRRLKPELLRLLEEPRGYPLSQPQRALWFLYQTMSASAAYNGAFVARIRSQLDVEAMAEAFAALVKRHPMLRTTYELRDGDPVQWVQPRMSVDFEVVNLEGAALDQIRDRAVADIRIDFDLGRGPLLRARLYRRAQDDYVLFFAAPHIAMDGWSVWLILDELRRLYPAALEGEAGDLAPIPYRYVDYVEWQEELLTGPQGERLRRYWEDQLDGTTGLLDLPLDRDRPAVFRFAGHTLSFSLGAELSADVRRLARQEGVTLFTLLLAAYQALLHRYTGQDQILVGSPMTGRTRPEFAPVVGCFINSVTLRADFESAPSFRSLLHAVHATALEALEHQDYPLSFIARRLRSRDASRNAGFQTDFVFQKPQVSSDVYRMLEGTPIDFAGLRMEAFPVPQQVGQLDLTLEMMEGPDEIVGDFKYHSDLFEAATADRMIGHFMVLVRAAVADPDQLVTRLPIPTPAERAALLDLGRGPEATVPEGSLLDCFEDAAAREPDRVAVVVPGSAGRRAVTYAELDALADRVRVHLDAADASQRVAYCLNPSERLVAAVLGIWRSGRVAVPIDPAQPSGRISQILTEVEPRVVLSEATVRGVLDGSRAHVLEWESLDDPVLESGYGGTAMPSAREAERSRSNEAGGRPGDAAYVIFTSGSTGKPKGVVVSHRSLLNAMRGWEIVYELSPADVHLQMAPPGFDVWMGDLARALGTGGTLVVCPREWLLVPERLVALVRDEGVTVAEFVPAVLREVRDHLRNQPHRLDPLRLAACGSDQWYQAEIEGFRRILPDACRLVNSYGVTEATIDSCWSDLVGFRAENGDRQVPIGRPFPNVRMYVLDRHHEPVPFGVVGELFLGGTGVAEGYLGKPRLDGDRFVPDPHEPNGRMYRTGDLARVLPDGSFQLVGRSDAQVKIRGNRVELGEIEARLVDHPAVRAAVAVFEPAGADSGGKLGAFVVPEENRRIDADELRAFVRDRLPEYMVPGPIETIDHIPLSANGKVDRKAVPRLDEQGYTAGLDRTGPRTDTEATLLGIWKEVLDLDGEVGVHADFFQLGGHSLLGTRMIWMVGDRLGVDLPFHAIFEAPTVAKLATKLEAARVPSAVLSLAADAVESFEF